MTASKKFKRKIRDRADRTGESYAAARRHVAAEVDRQRQERSAAGAAEARSQPSSGAVTEERCVEVTGHGFDHWFAVLDRFGAARRGHTASARHLQEEHDVSAWYAQSITVVYERARGLRAQNQACTGGYQVSVSRVLAAPLGVTARFLQAGELRRAWQRDLDEAVARALEDATIRNKEGAVWARLQLPDAHVELRISATSDGRSRVGATVTKLESADAVATHRAAWRSALDALKQRLRQLDDAADQAP